MSRLVPSALRSSLSRRPPARVPVYLASGTVAMLCAHCDNRVVVSPAAGTHSITVPSGAKLGSMLPGVGPQPSITPGIQCGTCGETFVFQAGVVTKTNVGTFVVPGAAPAPAGKDPEPAVEAAEALPEDSSPLPGSGTMPDLSTKTYRELQALAKRLDVPPRGARAALEAAIREAYDSSSGPAS